MAPIDSSSSYDSVANDQLKGRQTLKENAFIFQQN